MRRTKDFNTTTAYTTLTPYLQKQDTLLWAGYQRTTSRVLIQLLGTIFLWLLASTALAVVIIFFVIACQEQFDPRLLEMGGWIILGVSTSVTTGIPLWLSLYRRLRYQQSIIYGFSDRIIYILNPWQPDTLVTHDLATLPYLKIFAQTDGTFNVSYLEKSTYYHQGEEHHQFKTHQIFLDAIGDRATVQQLQQLQRAAKETAQ